MSLYIAPPLNPATTWKPMSEVIRYGSLEKASREARIVASDLGHILGPEWHDDGYLCLVVPCLVCGELAAIDLTPGEPDTFNGRALTRPCAGDPIW